MKKMIKNLGEMEKFAISVASKINRDKATAKAVILSLYGDLGSGKTTFTKSFISAFGVKQTVTSPTFVIEKIYKLPNNKINQNKNFKYIIHIDAYRLNNGEEMKDLGWEQIYNDPQNIILVEWPKKIFEILPKNAKKIKFKFIDEKKREVIY
ncbi:tRNA (adenosine(37)-N6)-threonylcarbamoyltransferase complex ATPase subunit type 1 TsaE [Candidatus Campbellbacteria bacterium RIFOXYC2_FULL_35_25]|uniref:tRNA threonylcarbamoyladenosine biosynthesis protein TsaE n=1 Tax=Candidatus Campbellbacteria bacterium RIFOXYC2_FULL_35_25 TaxID=1797582 RepID=A0A1F5EID5_9BACT|nr:MAG: tRNA (adenosine(37)-N6)-threonylcarbamoyltransferase complex ATPase subunit type 1 TsaE [Candidatus Campbellbacteria bacterium RIFOXYC2_FULL_35_25]